MYDFLLVLDDVYVRYIIPVIDSVHELLTILYAMSPCWHWPNVPQGRPISLLVGRVQETNKNSFSFHENQQNQSGTMCFSTKSFLLSFSIYLDFLCKNKQLAVL
jgi:hypothetical protein